MIKYAHFGKHRSKSTLQHTADEIVAWFEERPAAFGASLPNLTNTGMRLRTRWIAPLTEDSRFELRMRWL